MKDWRENKHLRWQRDRVEERRKEQPRKLRKVCAWCNAIIDEGDPGAGVTHGMCEACYGKEVER